MTITFNIEGASAEEIREQVAKLFAISNPTAAVVNGPTESAAEKKKRETKKKEDSEVAPPVETKTEEKGAQGYTYEDLQALTGQVEDLQQVKKIVQSGQYQDDKGVDCVRMSQIQPKDWAAFAGAVKLVIDSQI